MGDHNVELELDERMSQAFMKALLDDLRALDFMIETNRFETGVWRIGAEQEMFLVDSNMRPSPISQEVLSRAKDSRLTTEIARFNLEANLTPLLLTGQCLSEMERELLDLITKVRTSAARFDSDVLLSGILPTLKKSDLTLENLTPTSRYFQLNRGVIGLRGGPFSIHIKGLDELHLSHDNIMMESCNTSFQVHFQTSPPSLPPNTTWPRRLQLQFSPLRLILLSYSDIDSGRKHGWLYSNTPPTLVHNPNWLGVTQPG